MRKPAKTKPCPYCLKPLAAPTGRHWRNNVSAHLNRGTCPPYERALAAAVIREVGAEMRWKTPEQTAREAVARQYEVEQRLRAMNSFARLMGFDELLGTRQEDLEGRAADVIELTRMMNLRGPGEKRK